MTANNHRLERLGADDARPAGPYGVTATAHLRCGLGDVWYGWSAEQLRTVVWGDGVPTATIVNERDSPAARGVPARPGAEVTAIPSRGGLRLEVGPAVGAVDRPNSSRLVDLPRMLTREGRLLRARVPGAEWTFRLEGRDRAPLVRDGRARVVVSGSARRTFRVLPDAGLDDVAVAVALGVSWYGTLFLSHSTSV